MSDRKKYEDTFRREFDILARSREVATGKNITREDILEEYRRISAEYGRLLKGAVKITKIGDQSQKKLVKDKESLLRIDKIKVANGVYWIAIPEADLYVLCGCPADSVKLLIKRGLIVKKEKDGVVFETGPNAILLSDVSTQKGSFCNLAEFPVLQMLYRQGTILPGHPNNRGVKPMLIGTKDQVLAQSRYIHRGNCGLVSREELLAAGAGPKAADEIMRMKLRFSFDKILGTEDLLDLKAVGKEAVELRGGVTLCRKALNIYEFSWMGKRVTVDLNLSKGEEYESSYHLGAGEIEKNYFSVVHTGEGDGWDVNKPCMSSLVIFQGRIYLIDAGPNIMESLIALGISVSEIEGIFHTHAHDDHFAGLTSLIRSDHRLKYYAAPLVRASVEKKIAALMDIDEREFSKYFEPCDLELGKWNDVGGLEVRPVLSPHPIESSMFFFRALWEEGYKTYAHLADTISFDVLDRMVEKDRKKSGISPELRRRTRKAYLARVDLKKVDIGGGMIHGQATDFSEDSSGKIVLCHTEHPLDDTQKEIGSSAFFGMQSTLISSSKDYSMRNLYNYLASLFPALSPNAIQLFMNCPVEYPSAGEIFIRKGSGEKHICLLIEGVAEYIEKEKRISNKLSAGALLGETAVLANGADKSGTYRAVSNVKMLKIPADLYLKVIKSHGLYDDLSHRNEMIAFLQSTSLFGESVSFPVQNRIARSMRAKEFSGKEKSPIRPQSKLYVVEQGAFNLATRGGIIDVLLPGSFFGEEGVISERKNTFRASASEKSRVYAIPKDVLKDIPIVRWKLLEAYKERITRAKQLLRRDQS